MNDNNDIQRHNSRFVPVSLLGHELSLTRTLKWPGYHRREVMSNTSSTYHMQNVVILARWYEGTAQLLGLTEINHIYFSFVFWAELLPDGGEETRVPRENP